VDGIPGERIVHRRGLRQGDPLSPMLFILVMDVLSHMVAKAAELELLQPLSRRALQHRISLYADDVTLFLRPEAADIQITMAVDFPLGLQGNSPKFVRTSKLIYPAMAVDFPQWAYKAVDKIRRGYLWRGRREAKGGHCLVAWSVVCRPLQLGGLGISNFTILNWALRVRWLWLQKTEPHRPWSSLRLQVPDQVRALFSMAVTTQVGNGDDTILDRLVASRKIYFRTCTEPI
jgi:hypothetical protein